MSGERRRWHAKRDGSSITIVASDGEVAWDVFSRRHTPSAAARTDAGEIAGRETVTVSWAVPRRNRSAAGSFWAAFPDQLPDHPQRHRQCPVQDHRRPHDILRGAYNEEILKFVLPALVADNVAALVDESDPSSLLDLLPARGKEARSWADDFLNIPVMEAVSREACIPDMDGTPRKVGEVKLTPAYLADHGRWQHCGPGDRATRCVDPRERRHQARTACEGHKAVRSRARSQGLRPRSGWRHWQRAASRIDGRRPLADMINRAESEELQAVRRPEPSLHRRAGRRTGRRQGFPARTPVAPSEEPGFVDPAMVEDAETFTALTALGIRALDAGGRLAAQCARMVGTSVTGKDTAELWVRARLVPADVAASTIEGAFGRGKAPVRTLAARPRAVGETLLPGTVVPSDGSRDAPVTVDTDFHRSDQAFSSGWAPTPARSRQFLPLLRPGSAPGARSRCSPTSRTLRHRASG